MNSSDSNYERLLIPQPFASGTGAAYEAVSNTQISNKPNFVDGFPSAFSAPASNGGQYITRAQMNAIGRLATQNDFVAACGRVNTFDPEFCAAIGGYPLGAVLEMLVGTDFFHVVSLKENNDYNFLENGVDGINWAYCNEKYGDTDLDLDIMFEIPDMSADPQTHPSVGSISGYIVQPLTTFKAPRDGVTSFVGSLDFEAYDASLVGETLSSMIIVLFEGATPSAIAGKRPTAGTTDGTVVFGRGTSTIIGYSALSAQITQLTKGYYYSAWVLMSNCKVSNSTVKMKIC